MADSPTIIVGHLNDKELTDSISKLVATVKQQTEQMANDFDTSIDRMLAKLRELGKFKFDNAAPQGGSSKNTTTSGRDESVTNIQQITQATKQQAVAAKEVTMTYDQMQATLQKIARDNSGLKSTFNQQELQSYIDLLRKLQAEYIKVNTQEGGGTKSDKIKREIEELNQIIQKYQAILANIDMVNSRQGTIDVKKWVQDLGAVDDRYNKLVRWYRVMEAEAQRSQKAVEQYQNSVLKTEFSKVMKMPTGDVDQMQAKLQRLQTILTTIREFGILSPSQVANAETEIKKLTASLQGTQASITKVSQASIDVDKQLKLAFARANKIPTDQTDLMIAKLERLQSLLAIMRERGILSPTQIASAEVEIRRLELATKGVVDAQKSVTVEEQRATDEIVAQKRRVQELAAEVRRMHAEQKRLYATDQDAHFITRNLIYPENDPRARGLTIEQQIAEAIRKENEAYAQTAEQGRRIGEIERERLMLAGEIAQKQETQKRTYSIPTINDDYQQLMRNVVANKLGIDLSKVINADASFDSIKRVSEAFKQLQSAYSKLDQSERNSPIGRRMIQQMQELQRQLQQLNAQLSRPISLNDALKGVPKTIDEIEYKIRRLQSYKRGINITDPKQSSEIQQVDVAITKLQERLNKYMATTRQASASNNALTRSWNYMKNRLAFYFTVGASTQFVKNLIDVRGQYELLERSIGILINSAQNGSKIFSELNAMAVKSPFTTIELGAAAKQLVAYDVAANEVVDTTRRLADMAAAVGIPIERLTYALGQIKAYGYLNMRDARMFANAGIPLVKELADHYTEIEGRLVSTADVYDRIKKKAIDYKDVMEVVNNITDEGGKFFNFQEKAADTLKVRIANLTLAWNNMLNEIGKDSQGLLGKGLEYTKQIFEHWRDVNNAILAAVWSFGLMKAGALAYLTIWRKISFYRASNLVLGKNITSMIYSIGQGIVKLSNPITIATAAVTAFGLALTKAYYDYQDIIAANEQFNKSISEGAEENIQSIDKFLKEYKKQIDGIGGISKTDQQKMWERLQEEIENTTKNADDYISRLKGIDDISKRIEEGRNILIQSQEIEKAAKLLADSGGFSVGGGFMNDALADNLIKYETAIREINKEYGNLSNAAKDQSFEARKLFAEYSTEFEESNKELSNFTAILEKADMNKIIGDNNDVEQSLARIRDFSNLVRDMFLATEKGQKIVTEGQVLMNAKLDEWIAKQGERYGLIEGQRVIIEKNKTAWRTFFDQLNAKDKESLDYLIATNQTGSEEFKVIWDKAAKAMAENATSSYQLIQQQIANLRNTPDIVINVVYKETTEKLDEQQRAFTDKYITPSDKTLKLGAYLDKYKENLKKYGRFIKKENEDNVEWEKRLGEEYQKNTKSLEALNAQIANSKNMSKVDREEKEKEIETLKLQNEALEEIRSDQGFNYDLNGKQAKDAERERKKQQREAAKAQREAETELQKAFKDELQLIDKVRSQYKKLTDAGVTGTTALNMVTNQFGNTIRQINKILGKNGLPLFNIKTFAGTDNPNMILDMLDRQLRIAKTSKNVKPSEIKDLEVKVSELTIDAKVYNTKKIVTGLNNELSKLKDEYELSVEMDANPELSDVFKNMFNIDTSGFPKTIEDYMNRVQQKFDEFRKASGYDVDLNVFKASQKEWEKWAEEIGLSEEKLKDIMQKFAPAKDMAKKWAQDVVKQTKDLEYKLTDVNGKIAIEEEKKANLIKKLEKETNKEQRHLLELLIHDQELAIEKLQQEIFELLPTYKAVFGGIAEHSAYMTRKLAKQLKKMLEQAKLNDTGDGYIVTDPITGQKAPLSKKELGKQLDKVNKELLKSQSSFSKIREAFTKGKDDEIDFAKGLELIGEELQKISSLVNSIGDIAESLGIDKEKKEEFADIANSISGLGEALQGYAKIQNGDFIGGALDIVNGVWKSISTWIDNSNNKLSTEIERSQRNVARLELAYKDLQNAIEDAYGTEIIYAQKAAMANKEAQLQEIKRQLTLEESRNTKNKDEDKIIELTGRIKDLEHEILGMSKDIVNDLLGISDVGSAMESLMDEFVEALREGENAMEVFNETVDDMIANMVKKMFTTKILKPWFEQQWNEIQNEIDKRGSQYYSEYVELLNRRAEAENMGTAEEAFYKQIHGITKQEYINNIDKRIEEITKLMAESGNVTVDDIKRYAELLRSGEPIMEQNMEGIRELLQSLGLIKSSANANLSALQAGIQGITEETAGALEAYMNSVSQQVYLQSDLLTQIRDAVVMMNLDVEVATISQILLQLQASYQVQMSIQSTLDGWSNANGQAVRVELLN